MPFYNDIPFIGKYLKSNELVNEYTSTAIAKLGQAYQNVIGLGDNPVFSANAFKKLEEQRAADNIAVPGAVKGPDGISILEKTKDATDQNVSNAAKAVQSQMRAALKTEKAFGDAQDKFKANAAAFKELVKQIPSGGFGAQDVIGTMKYYVDKARTSITTQHNLDKKHLSDQFADPDFRQNLMTAYGISPGNPDANSEIDAIKNSMEKGLAAAHKKQLAEFDKSTADTFTQLHQAAAIELQKMGVIDSIKKADEDNVAMLEALAEQNRAKRQAAGAEEVSSAIDVHYDGEKAKLSHATLPDIKQFKSMTGMEIKQPTPGHFVLSFPTINPLYNQSSKQKPLADMLLVAQALKAQGYDQINWTIDIGDEDTLRERAKQAYEASVRSGIALENISVKDGKGRELKLEDIYKDSPEALDQLRQRAGRVKQEIEGINHPEANAFKNAKVKEAMKAIKEERAANPPEEEEEDELQDDAHQTPGR